MTESLKITSRGPVLEIVLDRPKANAIDAPTSIAMGEAFIAFRDDPDLRVAIVTGGGERFFSAGWDLKAAAEGEAVDADFGPGGFAGVTELFDLDKTGDRGGETGLQQAAVSSSHWLVIW